MRWPTIRLLLLMFAALPLVAATPARAAPHDPLEIGICPYYSAHVLLDQFEPMRAFLQARLERPVSLVSARDFLTFAERTRQRQYPIIVTVAHLARLAQVDSGYRPLLQMKARLAGVFLVEKNSPYGSVADLRGHSVGTPDRLAIITILGEEALDHQGLSSPTDVQLNPLPTHNAAILSVLYGENAGALVWEKTLGTMEPDVQARMRPIGTTAALPTPALFLADRDLPPAEAEAVTAAILAFAAGEGGKVFSEKTRFEGIIPVREEDLHFLDRFLPFVRRALAGP